MLQEIIFWIAVGLTVVLFVIWINKYKKFRENTLSARDRFSVVTMLPTLIIVILLLVIIKYYSINAFHLLWSYPLALFGVQFIIGLIIPKSVTKKWQDKW